MRLALNATYREYGGMERMQISLVSVVEHDGEVVAWAKVEAEKARIWVEVWFTPTTTENLWCRARDEVLRYLDPA